MTPLTVEDRLLLKTSETEKGWVVIKIIVAFPVRQWKWHMLFAFFRIIEFTGIAKKLVAIDGVRSELVHISSRLIT